jgi:hypothetical protein
LEDLFNRLTNPLNNAEKKEYATRYVDYTTEQTWKTFPEFKTNTKTYKEFKEAVLKYYPDASGDFIYSIRDMDMLTGERQRLGINSTRELSDYHLQFLSITTWLIDKGQLGSLEQQRAYIRVFQPELLSAIMNRLQVTNINHHPSKPYSVEKVYDAARFLLQGTSPSGMYGTAAPTVPKAASPIIPLSPEVYVKSENLGSMFAEFSKNIIEAFNQAQKFRAQQNQHQNHAHNHNHGNGSAVECNMCGGNHFIRDCKLVDEYIGLGKCRRNQDGKVVLPSGAFVSRDFVGKYLRDRIDDWHRKNPNQLAAATLVHTIVPRQTYETSDNPFTSENNRPDYQLSRNERVASLEAELFNLCTRPIRNTSSIQTRAQRAKAPVVDGEQETNMTIGNQKSRIEEVEDEEAPPRRQARFTEDPPVIIPETQPTVLPEHPYRAAKDAAYTPPTSRNVGAQDKGTPAVPKKHEPAYKTLPPIHDPAIAASVYKRSMEAQVVLTQRELLSLSPEVRSQVRDSTTTRRVNNKDNTTAQHLLQEDDNQDFDFPDYLTTVPTRATVYTNQAVHYRTPPEGSLIASDPIENYYNSLRPGEDPDSHKLTVSVESGAVRSIFILIDSSQKKECILDPGCQIVAMSANVCHDLGLIYDPSIRLHMQSANGEVDQSLGLSRNVPFTVGPLTFYLQVHIVKSPAYEVLLGRPFDILSESIVQNYANQDQTITVHDPNSGRRITIPTLARSKLSYGSCPHYKKQDFQ